MYTEDGFELRPVGDTMELYASGEIFHEDEPQIVQSVRRMQTHFPTPKILCDVRLVAFILDEDEFEYRARAISALLKDFTAAVICLADQRDFTERMAELTRAQDGKIEIFNSKAEARDWLELQTGEQGPPASSRSHSADVWQERQRKAG
ncbi:hypothetical protein [Maricaulis parjimensis]|uniref:hypothetical protein n=1 Tax=Maricaulis parjimensis TaxID=144023 RepID=UPI00193A9EEE|nr:hypothetical protein [Maricaulis parjimensis]